MSGARIPVGPRAQGGAVLIVSLIILIILTLIGVSGMTTTSMEERMASNSQEIQRAFQAAESGVALAFQDVDSFNLSAEVNTGQTSITNSDDDYDTTTEYVGESAPPINSGYSATKFQASHFNIESTGHSHGGVASGGAEAVLNAGAYQISPKL